MGKNKQQRSNNGAVKALQAAMRIPRGPHMVCPFPARMTSKFQYTTSFSLTEGSVGTGSFYVWNANSLYDPDVTSTGHQPLYYDQLMSVTGPYWRFLVTKVVVNIRLMNLGSSQIAVGIYPQVGPTDGPPLERLIEKPGIAWKLLSSASSGTPQARLQLSVSPAAVFGVSKTVYMSDDTYQGLYNSNPSRLCNLIFAVYAMAGAASVGSVTGVAQLTYTADLFARASVSSS